MSGLLERITPAHAGKTFRPLHSSRGFQDHPRACGENFTDVADAAGAVGSPPRMRGKPSAKIDVRKTVGITPAHAGKTIFFQKLLDRIKDHPRACGENHAVKLPDPAY